MAPGPGMAPRECTGERHECPAGRARWRRPAAALCCAPCCRPGPLNHLAVAPSPFEPLSRPRPWSPLSARLPSHRSLSPPLFPRGPGASAAPSGGDAEVGAMLGGGDEKEDVSELRRDPGQLRDDDELEVVEAGDHSSEAG